MAPMKILWLACHATIRGPLVASPDLLLCEFHLYLLLVHVILLLQCRERWLSNSQHREANYRVKRGCWCFCFFLTVYLLPPPLFAGSRTIYACVPLLAGVAFKPWPYIKVYRGQVAQAAPQIFMYYPDVLVSGTVYDWKFPWCHSCHLICVKQYPANKNGDKFYICEQLTYNNLCWVNVISMTLWQAHSQHSKPDQIVGNYNR